MQARTQANEWQSVRPQPCCVCERPVRWISNPASLDEGGFVPSSSSALRGGGHVGKQVHILLIKTTFCISVLNGFVTAFISEQICSSSGGRVFGGYN